MSALAPVQVARRALPALLAGMADDVPAIDIDGVAIDSRRASPGSLFLAYQGTRAHGLDHVDAAIAGGATAVAWDRETAPVLSVPCVHVPELAAKAGTIASRYYGEPSRRLFVAGVTGTDGKTSCAWMLSQALAALGERCGYMGTLGFGFRDDLAEASHTTPDAVAVHDWLARFAVADAGAVALEVSSHALDQHRVDGVAFDVAVLTQLGRDHLDYHGDMDRYAAAKRRLFAWPGLKVAVLNGDDAHGRAWLDGLDATVSPIVYGFDDMNRLDARYVRIVAAQAHANGLTLSLATSWGAARIESALVGRFNAMNLAAVLAVMLAREVAFDAAVQSLGQVTTVPGRMQRIDARADQPLVVVDYAHTPGALTHALEAVRAHAVRRVLCVFGCGGDRDRGKRALMGAAAAAADQVWVTDDNPRSEEPASIVAEILAGMADAATVSVEHDRRRAISAAIAAAGAGDVVLIAGKGHETTQQTGNARRSFDDRIEARRALGAA